MVRGITAQFLTLLICLIGVAAARPGRAAPPVDPPANLDAWSRPAAADSASALCRAAVRSAEYRYGIPRGLLLAIAEVETGRPTANGRGIEPWPWSANADNQSLFFPTRQDAVAWTRQALRRGVASINSGCLQVNLQQHPDAFASVDEAFEPGPNANYAARFLTQLHRETGSWPAAVGWYHSHTPTLADPYRLRVQAAFVHAVMDRRAAILQDMADAWAATRPAVTSRRDGACDAIGRAALRFDPGCGP